jgi:hypothetical protein
VVSSLENPDLKNVGKNLIPSFISSTTRSWNPGDEFILYGVRNLIESLIPRFNNFIYDRNPDYHYLRDPRLTKRFRSENADAPFVDFGDIAKQIPSFRNSLGIKDSLSNIDLAIFAGSPEWIGFAVDVFSEYILENKIPSIHLGLGYFRGYDKVKFSNLLERDQKVIRESLLITTRDPLAKSFFLSDREVHVLPCPALFSSKTEEKRTQKKKIALSTQGSGKMQGVSKNIFNYSVELFKELINLFDCEIICHYKEDYNFLSPLFGSLVNVQYSYDSKDYFDIYKDFDLTVTTRVHGAGICASMGIPGVCLSHTERVETVKGFLSEVINPEKTSVKEAVKIIQDLDVVKRSEEIINLKSQVFQEYQDLLKPIFQNLGFC